MSSENECVTQELKSFEAITYEVRGLHPDTRYRIHLRAHNQLGFSLPAQLYVQTALGEYNKESNEVPLRAGFYDVYTASEPLKPSSATTANYYVRSLVASFVLCLFLWTATDSELC